MPKKLLFLSDAVSCTSGLGRITRDLATRVHRDLSDVFEVASVGYGGPGSVAIPFHEYHLHDVNQWLAPELPAIWNDFVGDEEGVLMCCWDLSRLYWLGMPQTCPMPHLRRWVEDGRKSGKLNLWAYHAIDAEGPQGRFPLRLTETLKGFDRVLDYSKFSSRITGNPDHLPHGIDTTVFFPRDHKEARQRFIERGFQGLKQDSPLAGIVATNQSRKNWQLGMETVRILLDRGHDVRLWAHTDALQRHWDIGSLVADYGLAGRVAITTQRFSDEELSWMYSGCDVTLGIGPEGFGYPIAESLACGVPCIAGSYGAQAEFVPAHMQVKPTAFYYEGAFCSKRPVHDPLKWADRVLSVKGSRDVSLLPESVDWSVPTLWSAWKKWFEDGLNMPKKPIGLQIVRDLNYDHHRRMTEAHNARKLATPSSNEVENKDDASFVALLAHVPHVESVLELGCSSGGQWSVLKEWGEHLTGLDLYEPQVKDSQERGLDIHLGFVEEMPFPDESFDLVCCRHVMEHVGDIQKALSEIKRVLKPGGYFASVTPHYFPDPEPAHVNQLKIDQWRDQVSLAGFSVIEAELRTFNCPEAHIVARIGEKKDEVAESACS